MPLIETSAGALFAAQRGEDGPALLFIHGAGGTHQHWGHQLNDLATFARIIAPDLPGYGRSPGPAPATIAGYADQLLALLDTLGITRAVLAGHSMGAAIALHLAIEQPARIAGLALLGGGARMRVAPAFVDGLERDPLATAAQISTYLYADEAPSDLVSEGSAAFQRNDPATLRNSFIACDLFDVRERLAEVICPTLIICGEHDKMTPPKLSTALQSAISNARLEILPDTGHMPMLERPAEVTAMLRELLRISA